MMGWIALFGAAAAAASTPVSEPPRPVARASTQVFVTILQAAEIRDGAADVPHRRRTRVTPDGNRETLVEFE